MTNNPKVKYRVGLIGCGRKGTEHARSFNLNPMSEIVAAADTDAENLELFCRRFDVPGYSSYEEMIRKERIDIAAPILPVSVNPEIVVGCARAGVRAILSEKPLAASLEDADLMVEECRSRGIPYAAGDVYRNLPQLWAARRMIEAGDIGEVLSINLYHPNGQAGCEGINTVPMFAEDADINWVVGSVGGDPFADGDDGVKGVGGYVRFADGVECFSHYRNTAKRGVEVLGSGGVFFSDFTSFRLWRSAEDGAPLEEDVGLFPDSDIGRRERPYDQEGWRIPGSRQRATTQSIIDVLEKGIAPTCSGADSRKALEAVIAMRESARRGHAPVKLPLQDRTLAMFPRKARWVNKKELYGRESYMEMLRGSKIE